MKRLGRHREMRKTEEEEKGNIRRKVIEMVKSYRRGKEVRKSGGVE